MKRLRRACSRLIGALMGRQRESDLAEELESHIRMQTDDNLRLGIPPEQARRAAMLKFGSVESAKESMRDQRGLPRFEARGLFRNGSRGLTLHLPSVQN